LNDMEMIRNKRILNIMFSAEKFFLDQSKVVSTISLGMERKIAAKGIDRQKQLLFPNWVDCDFIRPLGVDNSLRESLGIAPDIKVVMYSGNLGEKQGLELILDAASHFHSDSQILFIIVGMGGAKERLMRATQELKLTNVRFFPLQSYQDLPRLLAVPDVHLVLQKKEAADLVMPSKLTGILSSGGLAVVSALPGTTLYDVINDHEMGILIEPGSADALIEGITCALSLDNRGIIKENARNYAETHLGKESVLAKLDAELAEVLL